MKTGLLLMSLVVLFGGALLPQAARADSSFSFSISDSSHDRRGHGWHDRGWHHGRHDPYRPVRYYAPPSVVYVRPAPTVIYETSVIREPVRYVEPSAMVVDPSSPPFYNEAGQQCREYQSSAWVSGRQNQIYGTACLQPDGAWRVVD